MRMKQPHLVCIIYIHHQKIHHLALIMVMYYWLFLGMKIQYTNLFLLLLAMNIKESNQQHGENGNYAKMTTTYIYFYT